MSATFDIRKKLIAIHRRNVGKVEVTKNRAPWIKPLWAATAYPDGMDFREPYCAAGQCWGLREWLRLPEVLVALGLTTASAEKWRCKSAGAFAWGHWARDKGLKILGEDDNFHTGDIIIFRYSHIEVFVDDLPGGKLLNIGYNTAGSGADSREGDGCFEKPRPRANIKEVIRMLP